MNSLKQNLSKQLEGYQRKMGYSKMMALTPDMVVNKLRQKREQDDKRRRNESNNTDDELGRKSS